MSCDTDSRFVITWEKENGIVTHERANGINSNILTLINLRPQDAGNYRCVVEDSFYGNSTCSSDYASITVTGNYIIPYIANYDIKYNNRKFVTNWDRE